MTDHATSWVEVSPGSDFPIQNLPYGVVHDDRGTRCGVRIGDSVLDLAAAQRSGVFSGTNLEPDTFAADSLNGFIAQGQPVWRQVRAALTAFLDASNDGAAGFASEHELLIDGHVTMRLPVRIGDYVDFYSSEHHATNLGRMFRPDTEPLLENWKHLPVGYHGRAGTVVVSGTDIHRPSGQTRGGDGPTFGPTSRLDIELEVGFVTDDANVLGEGVDIANAEEHIFGVCLVNDWSARDIQAWEYVPLGPFLGKSFATSISPWLVPLDALAPFRVPLSEQEPTPLPYLVDEYRAGIDIDLSIAYSPSGSNSAQVVTETSFLNVYWSMAQQLTHATANGASASSGDLFASGTISGPGESERGSLIEITWNGSKPIEFEDGVFRTFLEDGDTITLRGTCDAEGAVPIGFGECTGTVVP